MCNRCETLAAGFSCAPAPAAIQGKPIPRRRSLEWLMGGGLAALLAAGMQHAKAADDERIRLGYLPITDATALLVAYAKGFFTDEGLKAERPTLMRAWAPMVEAFAAGKFNLVHLLAPLPIWMRYNNHVPVKQIAWAHVNGSALTVGPHSKVTRIEDLGGTTIAVPFWYSIHNILLQQALAKGSIEPILTGTKPGPRQCALVVMPPPQMLPSLASGKIDGYIVAEPFNAMGELALGARILRFTGDIWKDHPCCVACVPEAMTARKPAWTQKVANALVRAEHYAAANRTEVAKLISRDGAGFLPMPAKTVERAMTVYASDATYLRDGAIIHPSWHDQRIGFSPYPYPSAMALIVNWMKTTKVAGDASFLAKLDPAFVQRDLVDDSFVRAALARYPVADASSPFLRKETFAI